MTQVDTDTTIRPLSDWLWPPLADQQFTLGLRKFVQERIVPEADKIDEKDIYPVQLAKDLARGIMHLTAQAS